MKSGSIKIAVPAATGKQSFTTGSGTSSSSSISNITTRTIQEQLRVDHIEALAEITRLSKENEALQKQLDDLRLTAFKSPNQESTSSTDSLLEIKKIRDSNITLTNENNRLKEQVRRIISEEKQKSQEQLSRQSEEFTLQIRRLQEQMKDLESHNSTLHQQLDTFRSSVNASEESTDNLQKKLKLLQIQHADDVATVQERDRALTFANHEISTLRDQSTYLQQQHIDLQLQQQENQQTIEDLQCKQAVLQSYVTEKSAALAKFEQDNAQLHARILQLQSKLQEELSKHPVKKTISHYGDSDSDEEDDAKIVLPKFAVSVLPTKSMSIDIQTDLSAIRQGLVLESEQQPTVEETATEEDALTPHSVRFQEYLRLKRENRELKLRLADRDQQLQLQQQAAARQSRNPNMNSKYSSSAGANNNSMARSATTTILPKLTV